MFSALPPLSHNTFQSSHYAPAVSSPLSSSPLRTSPLSPRDGNTCFTMSSPSAPSKQTQRCSENMNSRRQIKKNPLVHKGDNDNGRETRRKLFLRRVREDSEDKRWERRGGDDEIMRTIWIAEQRRREERRAREAQSYPGAVEEEEDNEQAQLVEWEKDTSSQVDDMADEVAQQEDAEMEALLSMLETDTWDPPPGHHQQQEENNTPYGSDDDEYDQLFREISMDEADGGLSSQPIEDRRAEDHDMMDMS